MKLLERKIIFFVLFLLLGIVFLQVPFTKLAGSQVSFTLFDFFAPIAGAFLGPIFGILMVFTVELINVHLHNVIPTTGVIIRLFPTLFATYYFAVSAHKRFHWYVLAVPVVAILLFVINPVGRTVWYYSLFWLIPIFAYYKRSNLFLRSLGATFTAHAVGGAAWVWAFHLPAAVWKSLIPVVIEERLFFAAGISLSYLILKRAILYLSAKRILPTFDPISS